MTKIGVSLDYNKALKVREVTDCKKYSIEDTTECNAYRFFGQVLPLTYSVTDSESVSVGLMINKLDKSFPRVTIKLTSLKLVFGDFSQQTDLDLNLVLNDETDEVAKVTTTTGDQGEKSSFVPIFEEKSNHTEQ